MLKSKKHNTQAEWVGAWEAAKLRASTADGVAEAERIIDKCLDRFPSGTSVYGWSGGKDSIALGIIAEAGGFTDGVLTSEGERWEWPSFVRFVKENKPKGVKIREMGITADFLNERPELVWPTEYRFAWWWTKQKNQNAVHDYVVKVGAENLILGHRTQDGNWCNGGRPFDKGKFRRCFPMHDLTHEDVFLLIAYGGIGLPDQYFYEDGFMRGTRAWIVERNGDEAGEKIWRHDRGVLYANMDVDVVRRFVERKEAERNG